jgi:hypothetical protein
MKNTLIATLLLALVAVPLDGLARANASTLVIERVVVNETPQSGTWLMCFHAQVGDIEGTFNIPDREYSGDGITIPMNLQLSPVEVGDTVDFSMQLDDDQADVCDGDAEDKSADTFTVGRGTKRVVRGDFNYVVHYRVK